MNTNIPTLDSFCNGAATVLGIESALSGKPVDSEWVKKIAVWKTGLFRIVVMGEIKKGKSSFINALLGYKDLVPVCSDVATSAIFKITYGREVGYKVFFIKSSGKAPAVVRADEINAYGTEDGNPGNVKQVDFIQVFCPSPILKSGLVLIDTPGLGGLFKQHKRITYQYVPNADAVFLVTDSVESPIGKAELDLLGDLKKVTKHIFFVQTKSRLVDKDVRDARKENNIRSLCDLAGFERDKIRYFVVDSALKLVAEEDKNLKKLERSGFDDVARFMNVYIRTNVHRLLIMRAFTELRPRVDNVSRELDAQGIALQVKNDGEREKIIQEIKKEQAKLQEWENSGKRRIFDFLDEGFSEIRRNAIERVARYRPNGIKHQEILSKFSAAESAEKIQELLSEVHSDLGGALTEEIYKLQTKLQRESIDLVLEVGRRMETEIKEVNLSVEVQPIDDKLQNPVEINKTSGWDNFRNNYMGGSLGMSIGALVGSVVPVVGTVAGGLVGGIIGWWQSSGAVVKQQTCGAKNQANAIVGAWLSNCYADMQQKVSEILDQIRRKVKGIVLDAIESAQYNNKKHIEELKSLGQETSEKIAKKTAELQKRRALFKRALGEMRVETEVPGREI